MCHPFKSDIANDPRVPYLTSVESFTNIYKFSTGQGGSYGHEWNNVVMTELVRFNGILVRDGVLGRSNGDLYEIWNPNSSIHIPEIDRAMILTRFSEIKRNINLCNNNAARSKYQESYDLAYKFDPPYKSLVTNTNTI